MKPDYDWHKDAIAFAKSGLSYKEIYYALARVSVEHDVPVPNRSTMEGYLRVHKTEWYETGMAVSKYRKYALQAAKDLCYPEAYIDRIKHAMTENQISRIMREARAHAYAD